MQENARAGRRLAGVKKAWRGCAPGRPRMPEKELASRSRRGVIHRNVNRHLDSQRSVSSPETRRAVLRRLKRDNGAVIRDWLAEPRMHG